MKKIKKKYSDEYSTEELEQFVSTFKPCIGELYFKSIEETYGWTKINATLSNKNFSIEYSEVTFDTSILIDFFVQIISLNESQVVLLNNEGTCSFIYVAPIDKKKIRITITNNYRLYQYNSSKEYSLNDSAIDCDVIVEKNILLKEFHSILVPFINKYIEKHKFDEDGEIEEGIFEYQKKCLSMLDKIDTYLSNNASVSN